MANDKVEPRTTSEQLAPPIPSVTPTPNPTPTPTTIKKANKPFLVHQKYKQQQSTRSRPDSSSSPPSFLVQALKSTLLALFTSLVLSRAITQTWTWGYGSHLSSPLTFVKNSLSPRRGPLTLTEIQLSLYDGTQDPNLPIYLAIDGDVYDVTRGRDSYGPGGAYNIFAGRDAARAFVTGCFQTHLTHDLRGFNEKELATLKHWKQFYETNDKYPKVGRVMHPPIDESSPIPEPCTVQQGKVGQPDAAAVVNSVD